MSGVVTTAWHSRTSGPQHAWGSVACQAREDLLLGNRIHSESKVPTAPAIATATSARAWTTWRNMEPAPIRRPAATTRVSPDGDVPACGLRVTHVPGVCGRAREGTNEP